MEKTMNKVKSEGNPRSLRPRGRRWFWGAIAAAVVVALGGSFFAYRHASATKSQTTLPTGAQLSPVTQGSVQRTVSAFGNISMPQQTKLSFGSGGVIQTLKVKMGGSVKKGDVLASLDPLPLDLALLQAQDSLATAQKAFSDAQAPYTDTDLVVAQAQEAAAEAQLSGATSSWGSDPNNLSKWASVQSAQASLATAKDKLAKVQAGADPDVVASAQRKLTIAQANLDNANKAKKESTIIAPYDGIVANVYFDVGDRVSSDVTPVILLVGPTQFEFEGTVDEIDVPQVSVGQQVAITVDALPGVAFQGVVTAISPVGTRTSGVVSFAIIASVQGVAGGGNGAAGSPPTTSRAGTGQRTGGAATPSGAQAQALPLSAMLKDNLTASGTITIERRDNVLLVPSRAVQVKSGKSTVTVVNANVQEVRDVVVGITDGSRTQIMSGIKAGEQVLIPATTLRAITTVPGMGGGFSGPAGR